MIETSQGKVLDKILRLDLFRKLDKNEQEKLEFTGGIMHVMKHFSVNDRNLSTGKDIYNLNKPEDIIELIVKAFFIEEGNFETSTKLISMVDINEKYRLKFVFYLEEKTNVFFLKTIHKKSK